jgi:DNA replication and repair protein RecF
MPAALRLRRISLKDFRNHATLTWQPSAPVAIITGPNGAGKTNLLEAVSLLAPGRGLRGARLGELGRQPSTAGGRWAVAGRFEHPSQGPLEVATGTLPEGPSDRRVFRLDGLPASHAAISDRIAMAWLTPEMGRLFYEGPASRRRFLDRLVYALEPGHARELAAYETAMSGRNRLLAKGGADPAWLAGTEESMARHAVAIAAARSLLVARLVRILPEAARGLPKAKLALACPVAERLTTEPALAVEEWLIATLADRRDADREAGAAGLGVHRSDLVIRNAASGAVAIRASTGEQKALLLSVVLAHAALLAEQRGFAPLLLLDEPVVHLDSARRSAFLAILGDYAAQILLSGTDAEPFRALGGHAEVLRVG